MARKDERVIIWTCRTCGTRHEIDAKASCHHCNGCSRTYWKHYDYGFWNDEGAGQ